MSENEFRDLSATAFRRIVFALGALFLAIEAFCILRLPLVMDEFVDAEIVHRLASKLPYRDLPVGKTVLAYYMQLPALLITSDGWNALLAVKFEMAVLAAAAIIYAALSLARDYSHTAVVFAFTLLISVNTFYERAADFRSDMLTAMAGLMALLSLLRRRPAWSGFWCGVSLMMSQKGAYYVLASEAALAVAVAAYRRRQEVREFIAFNAAAFITFGAYLLFWMMLSSPHDVLYNTFVAQQTNAFGTHFEGIRWTFWSQTLRRNPVFYGLSAAAISFLLYRAVIRRDDRFVLPATYGVVLSALCIWHKQPWPYFFVMLVPLLFVLQVPLFDFVVRNGASDRRRLAGFVVVAGAAAAIFIRLPASLERDSGFQRSSFRLGAHILSGGGTYFAGVPIFYTIPQAGGIELNSIDTVQREYLDRLSQSQLLDIVRRLDAEPVRFVVFSYRIDGLPLLMRQYLVATFEPYWGSIFIYAPKIRSGPFTLHFDGDYSVESATPITIDDRTYARGGRVRLTRGVHEARSATVFRLRLDPRDTAPYLDRRYQEVRDFFPAVYTF